MVLPAIEGMEGARLSFNGSPGAHDGIGLARVRESIGVAVLVKQVPEPVSRRAVVPLRLVDLNPVAGSARMAHAPVLTELRCRHLPSHSSADVPPVGLEEVVLIGVVVDGGVVVVRRVTSCGLLVRAETT